MPFITINSAHLHFEDTGEGPETIVFIHGLMLASESYEAQREAFQSRYRVVTFDLRGQGRSSKTRNGLDLDSLAADTAALIEKLSCSPCHLVGFSMGAFIAMRIAARCPELVRSLALIGPSADAEDPANLRRYSLLIRLVSILGPRPVAGHLMRILFGDTYLQAREHEVERKRWLMVLKNLPRALHRAAAASAGRSAINGELSQIKVPTLVVSGEEDRPISPARARAVSAGIEGSVFVAFAKTGHAVMIEQPQAFNRVFGAFLAGASAQEMEGGQVETRLFSNLDAEWQA